jgi:hypothetical protein
VIDEIHVEVARLVFFALPESAGYAVGGGVAALAHYGRTAPSEPRPRTYVSKPCPIFGHAVTAQKPRSRVLPGQR